MIGDSFTIGPSALRHIEKAWSAIYKDVKNSSYDAWVSFHRINGQRVAGPER